MWPFGRLRIGSKNALAEPSPVAGATSSTATCNVGEESAPGERRNQPRHGVGAPTLVLLPGEPSGVRALIRDISKGGCLLETKARLQIGTRLSLAFLSRSGGHCHAAGCVVRVAADGHFGVQFSKVNMAFLGFVGSVSSASPAARVNLIGAMRGTTVQISAAP